MPNYLAALSTYNGAYHQSTIKIWSDKLMKEALRTSAYAKFFMTVLPSCPICCTDTECDSRHTVKDLIKWYEVRTAMDSEHIASLNDQLEAHSVAYQYQIDRVLEQASSIAGHEAKAVVYEEQIAKLEERNHYLTQLFELDLEVTNGTDKQ